MESSEHALFFVPVWAPALVESSETFCHSVKEAKSRASAYLALKNYLLREDTEDEQYWSLPSLSPKTLNAFNRKLSPFESSDCDSCTLDSASSPNETTPPTPPTPTAALTSTPPSSSASLLRAELSSPHLLPPHPLMETFQSFLQQFSSHFQLQEREQKYKEERAKEESTITTESTNSIKRETEEEESYKVINKATSLLSQYTKLTSESLLPQTQSNGNHHHTLSEAALEFFEDLSYPTTILLYILRYHKEDCHLRSQLRQLHKAGADPIIFQVPAAFVTAMMEPKLQQEFDKDLGDFFKASGKTNKLLAVVTAMENLIKNISFFVSTISAGPVIETDTLLSMISYLMMRSEAVRNDTIHAHLNYLVDFISSNKVMEDREGYLILSLKIAVDYITKLDVKSLLNKPTSFPSSTNQSSPRQQVGYNSSDLSQSHWVPKKYVEKNGFVVLNDGDGADEVIKSISQHSSPSPSQLSTELIYLMRDLFRAAKYPHSTSSQELLKWKTKARSHPMFLSFLQRALLLQTVDLSSTDHKSLLCFWINIYHSLLLHMFITVDDFTSQARRLIAFRSYSYKIGTSYFPIVIIEHAILRAKTAKPEFFGSYFVRIPKFLPNDPSANVALQQEEPLVSFVLSSLSKSSPEIQVMTPETVDSIITKSTIKYLSSSVKLNVDFKKGKRELVLPKIMEYYRKDFPSNQDALVQWISLYLLSEESESKEGALKFFSLSQFPLNVKYSNYDWSWHLGWATN